MIAGHHGCARARVRGAAGRIARRGIRWTRLAVTPETGVRAVDGLLTGWHEPRSSHLRLLEAVGGRELVDGPTPRSRAATSGTSSATCT